MALNKIINIKFAELLIACILVALHHHSFVAENYTTAMFTMCVFGGYLIVLAGPCLGIILGFVIDRRLNIFYSAIGCILFIIIGAVVLNYFTGSSCCNSLQVTGIFKGCFSLIEGILFLIDAVLVFRGDS
ncbi:uncharacterized protein LOC143430094 [Xylocopa sonorina]|uniref:uncharacterized protein LOC143430094 n=1 Tax=Xylocopa sonorina TaxID=1818115 RepID=UPI00403AA2B4